MDRYIASGFTDFDYSGYPPPTNLPPVGTDGILFGQVNTKGGYIYGAELAGTLPFDLFSPRSRASGSPAALATPRPGSRISTGSTPRSPAIRSGSEA